MSETVTVTSATTIADGDAITTDTRSGSFVLTVPTSDDWCVTLHIPGSRNPDPVTIEGGARLDPEIGDFIGYSVELYPRDARTIIVRPLEWIREEEPVA